jgi:hypothetical protein
MGFIEAHEGEQSLRVKFHLTDDSQAGNAKGLLRCAGAQHARLPSVVCFTLHASLAASKPSGCMARGQATPQCHGRAPLLQ